MENNTQFIELAEQLYTAVKAGDVEQATRLLDAGASWEPFAVNNTPLHIAARQGDIEMTRLLLAREHPVDGEARRRTPLSLAAQRGDMALMNLLLDHGANPTLALSNAIYAEQDDAATLLVERGADVGSSHRKYSHGARSPLLWALQMRLPKTARAMIAHGADVTATSGTYKDKINALDYLARSGDAELAAILAARGLRSPTALHAALHSNHLDVVPYVLEGASFTRGLGKDKETALHLAAALNVKSVFEHYLAQGKTLDVTDNTQNTPLHEALGHRNYDLATFLYDHGASMTAAAKSGVTGVYYAAQAGYLTLLERWIAEGGETNMRDSDGKSPLLKALPEHPAVALLLIQNGAEVNATGQVHYAEEDGGLRYVQRTAALHQAARAGLVDVTRTLLAYRAKLRTRDDEGRRAVDIAREAGHAEIVALLEAKTRETPDDIADWLVERIAAYRAEFTQHLALWEPLQAAVRCGDTATVARLLDEGAVWMYRWLSPLSIAAGEGHLALAKELLARGYSPNDYPKPLHLAVARGDLAMVKLLLAHGADLSVHNYDDSYWHQYKAGTPLQWAIEARQPEIACWLIERGADVTAEFEKEVYLSKRGCGGSNMTINYLLYALSYQLPQVAQALIAHDADLHATYGKLSDISGKYNALDLAAGNDYVEVMALLMAHGLEIKSSALSHALRSRQDEAVRWLIGKGAGLDVHDSRSSESVLHRAAENNTTWLAVYWLAQGRDVDVRGSLDRTPLHSAARANQARMTAFLIARGAQVAARDRDGKTTLHVAAAFGALDAAQVLLDHGAEIDARNELGATPLAEALQHKQVEMVIFLHRHGATLDVVFKKETHSEEKDLLEAVLFPSNSYSSKTYDVEGRYLELARFLIDAGAVDAETAEQRYQQHLNQRLIWVVEGKDRDTTAEEWVKLGADIECVWEGATPLYHALRRKDLKLTQALIALGANVERADAYGFTALHYAADLGAVDLAQGLLEKGVDVNASTHYGYAALHYAAGGGDLEFVNWLLAAGADPAATLTQGRLAGWTPLHFALSHKHAPVADLLRPLSPPVDAVKPGSHGLRGAYDDGPVSLGSSKRKTKPIINYRRARCPTCNEMALHTVGQIWDGSGYDADFTLYLTCANCETNFTRSYDHSLKPYTGRLPRHRRW